MAALRSASRPLPFAAGRPSRAAVVAHARPPLRPAWAARPLLGAGALLLQPAQDLAAVEDLPSRLPSPEQVASQAGDGGGFFDLFADNPVLVVGLGLLALFPLAFSFLGGGTLGVKSVTAAGAFEGLSSDPATVLLDIRPKAEVKQQGSPNLGSIRKKPIQLPFTTVVGGEPEEVEEFVEQFGRLKQLKPDSSIIILDSFGQEAPKAAKLLAKLAGRVYYVIDGAEGIRGWREAGQPWKEPFKAALNLDSIAEDFKSQPTVAKAGVAVGALGVAGALLFQEVGTALEVAAVAAAGAWALPRFLSPGAGGAGETGGTQRRQVQEFVEQQEAQAGRAAAAAERQAGQAAARAQEAAQPERVESGLKQAAAKAQEAVQQPQQAAGKAAAAAEGAAVDAGVPPQQVQKAESKVEEAAGEAVSAASKGASEAREWIEQWRKENVKA